MCPPAGQPTHFPALLETFPFCALGFERHLQAGGERQVSAVLMSAKQSKAKQPRVCLLSEVSGL